jgi:hypothetical protein
MENGSMQSDADFLLFWLCYPRKQNKGDARKAWAQTARIRPPITELLAAVERGKSSVQWHKADRDGNVGAFVPYPGTWLRAEGWENVYSVQLSSIKTHTQEVQQQPVVSKPSESQIALARAALASTGLRLVG